MSGKQLEEPSRTQLSRSLFTRESLQSNIVQDLVISALLEDPDLVNEAGRRRCEEMIEPTLDRLGWVSIRFGYRPAPVNAAPAEDGNQYRCAADNTARHVGRVAAKKRARKDRAAS